MLTEIDAIKSARVQYRAAFRQMAQGGRWHIYKTPSGITLDREGTHMEILVGSVERMAEETMVNALSAALRT